MASVAYDSLCHEIYDQIYKRLQRRDDDRLRFATRGTAKKVLHPDILQRFFRSILLPDSTALTQFGVREEELVARVSQRHLHDFLAIMIFATCHVEDARVFAQKLVATNAWPVRDRRGQDMCSLPADRDRLFELFEDEVTTDKFFTKQACFCTVSIHKREEVPVDEKSQRLPYLEEKLLGKGSFGTVYKVKIAKGHFFDSQGRTANIEAEEMARKDYIISKDYSGQEEREIMEKILNNSARRCENILENYGSLQLGTTTYSLFMPLAICDLRAWMLEHHQTRPKSAQEKASIIWSAKGLAGGLNFLHNDMTTSDMEGLVCYHMDLKPSNILIFRDHRDGQDFNIWKLSDFGMSRVKVRHRGEEKDKDFNRWFVRRNKPEDPSLSATLNRRGEGTYLAPESLSSTRSMKAESDVWSLGCVISIVFAYMEEGRMGVEAYQDTRGQHPSADGYDRFFLRGVSFMPPRVHPAVKTWHSRLAGKARERDHEEGEAVKYMLGYLESSVFEVNQFKRDGAKEVEMRLRDTYLKYSRLGEVRRASTAGGPYSPPLVQSIWQRMRPRPELAIDRKVEGWHLSASEAFKSCEISPDGSLIAYWTDTKISLYTSQSLSSKEANVATPVAEYSLEMNDCIWKSVSLTQKYLVASTTGANFHCYIFDLDRGASVDASFDHKYRLALARPEISILAISPNSQRLSFVLKDKEGDENPGSLYLVPMAELIRIARRPRSSSTDETVSSDSLDSNKMANEDPWWLERLDWPAADVTQLLFSTNADIYITVRPELTVRSREHKIPIMHFNLQTKTLHCLNIESRGFDTGSTTGMFTTFAPFRREAATCAVVTREKDLYIERLDDEGDASSPRSIHKEIYPYRVLKIMVGSRDDRLYCLGRISANHKMLLLEMMVPRTPADEVVVRELAFLQGLSYQDELVARLSDDGTDEKCVLIAALVGANRRAIYRVRLPEGTAGY